MALLNVLIMILIVCVVLGLIYWVVTMLPLPDPFGRIIQVCVVVIGVLIIVLMLLRLIGIGPGVGLGRVNLLTHYAVHHEPGTHAETLRV